MNTLQVIESTPGGMVLSSGEDGPSVHLPNHEAIGLSVGDTAEVFVYTDAKQGYLATTSQPKALVNQMAFLRVVEINQTGAFLDWGLPKDLLLPYGEQKERLTEGKPTVVYIHKDKYAERLVASQRLNRHIGQITARYSPGEKVSVIVVKHTDLGYKVVVNHRHWGLLYADQVFKTLRRGQQTEAWVSKVVGDNKVDLMLTPPRKERHANASAHILAELTASGGFLGLHDKSSPQAIREVFGISKKNFKAAVGQLYRQRKITLEANGIRLVTDSTGDTRDR